VEEAAAHAVERSECVASVESWPLTVLEAAARLKLSRAGSMYARTCLTSVAQADALRSSIVDAFATGSATIDGLSDSDGARRTRKVKK
jgi:hypothetical protein